MKSHSRVIPVLTLVLAGIAVPLSSQISELPEYQGETRRCPFSDPKIGWVQEQCGLDVEYTYIFVGTVLSSRDISDTEKRLEVTPHEMFRGVTATQLTVVAEQNGCEPGPRPGED
jgi:hypothetical protein